MFTNPDKFQLIIVHHDRKQVRKTVDHNKVLLTFPYSCNIAKKNEKKKSKKSVKWFPVLLHFHGSLFLITFSWSKRTLFKVL